MHYYSHNIGDFNNSTRHLTRVERSLYRDLIELYYDSEQPLQSVDRAKLARKVLAHTDEEYIALNYVLEEFFFEDGDKYSHPRCDEEIAKYHANTSAKAKAGIASAKARAKSKQKVTPVEQTLNGCATNHKPINNKQETITKQTSQTVAAQIPDLLDHQLLNDFVDSRKAN